MEINRRIRFDRAMDYIPVLSTINILIDCIQKRVFAHISTERSSAYQQYIKEKPKTSCLIYAIPFGKIFYRIFVSRRDSVGVKSTDPFFNLNQNINKAFLKHQKETLSFEEFEQCLVDNFSKLLNSDLKREYFKAEAFELCAALMQVTTKPYALIANDEFFGWKESDNENAKWKENQVFIEHVTEIFILKHTHKQHSRYETKKADFMHFYNALDQKRREIVEATFAKHNRNVNDL